MTSSWSVSVVVPTFNADLALWLGIGEMLHWRHPAVQRLQVVIVDDGSPRCGFCEGVVRIDGVELVFLVNPANRGQAASCRCGLRRADGDWAVLLEDDLLGWGEVMTAIVDRFAVDVDVVSVARVNRARRRGPIRSAVQPAVRKLFRLATGCDLLDPTSPIKALRRAAFSAAVLERWDNLLFEGLVLTSGHIAEVVPAAIGWSGRPSAYRVSDLIRMTAHLAPRLLGRAVTGSLRRPRACR